MNLYVFVYDESTLQLRNALYNPLYYDYVADGDLYMWGWNESGQLGLPSPAIQQKKCKQMEEDAQSEEHQHGCSLHLCPEYVPIGSESIILVAAACGTRHTAVLSGKKRLLLFMLFRGEVRRGRQSLCCLERKLGAW